MRRFVRLLASRVCVSDGLALGCGCLGTKFSGKAVRVLLRTDVSAHALGRTPDAAAYA